MMREIADLGFTHAELSHGIRIVLVPGILRAVDEGFIKISSVHNFCPLPAGVHQPAPNLFQPSVSDRSGHEQWLRYTRRTLDFAAKVKAKVMVLHLGSVRFFWFPPSRKLNNYLQSAGGADVSNAKYLEVLRKACLRLRANMGPAWDQVLASMEEIGPYAAERGIMLGCENREKFEELPIDDDFDTLFSMLSDRVPCGYWHDTGHAQIKQELGIIVHRDHLARQAPRLLGFHLHDVNSAGKDHQTIGSGAIDFEMISAHWRPEHLLTLELSPRLQIEEVEQSKKRVDELVARRFG
jgi:sugar phosphate isomerase/epimerase